MFIGKCPETGKDVFASQRGAAYNPFYEIKVFVERSDGCVLGKKNRKHKWMDWILHPSIEHSHASEEAAIVFFKRYVILFSMNESWIKEGF